METQGVFGRLFRWSHPRRDAAPEPEPITFGDLVERYAFPLDADGDYGLSTTDARNPESVSALFHQIGEYRQNPVYETEVGVVSDPDRGNLVVVNFAWDEGMAKGQARYYVARISTMYEGDGQVLLAPTETEMKAMQQVLCEHGVLTDEEAQLFDFHRSAHDEGAAALNFPVIREHPDRENRMLQDFSPMLSDSRVNPLNRDEAIQRVWQLQDALRLARQTGQDIVLECETVGEADGAINTIVLNIGTQRFPILRDVYLSDGRRISAHDAAAALDYLQACGVTTEQNCNDIWRSIQVSSGMHDVLPVEDDGGKAQLLQWTSPLRLPAYTYLKIIFTDFPVNGNGLEAAIHHLRDVQEGHHRFVLPVPGTSLRTNSSIDDVPKPTFHDLADVAREYYHLATDEHVLTRLRRDVLRFGESLPLLSPTGPMPTMLFDDSPTGQQLVLQLTYTDQHLRQMHDNFRHVFDLERRFEEAVAIIFKTALEELYRRLN